MTDPFPTGSADRRESDQLHTFLDELASGNPDPSTALDPSLAATVRHVHGVGDQSVAADIPSAGKAQRWEDLMRTHVPGTAHQPLPTVTLPSATSAPRRSVLPSPTSSRLRRWGDHSMGLVATLAIVLLVGVAGTGLYLTDPGGGEEATMIPGGVSTQNEPAGSPGVVTGTPVANADGMYRITPAECTVEPINFDEVMQVVTAPLVYSDGAIDYQNERLGFEILPNRVRELRNGPRASPDLEMTLVARFQEFAGCTLPLQQARFFSSVGLQRAFEGEDYVPGLGYGRSWLQSVGVDIDPPLGLAEFVVGEPGRRYLYGFRMLDDDRVGAYLALNQDVDVDALPPMQSMGVVVFVLDQGEWVIDSYERSAGG